MRPAGEKSGESLIVKLATPVLGAVTVAVLGFFTSQYLSQRQATEARVQLYTQLMSQREQSDSALRKDMFRTIFDSFLKGGSGSLDEQVLNLELLTYNFHESLNLKPLYVYLDKKIRLSHDRDKANLLKRMERVANDVATKQLMFLESEGAHADWHVEFGAFQHYMKQNPETRFNLNAEPASLVFGNPETRTDVTVYVDEINTATHRLTVELEYWTPGSNATSQTAPFSVSLYDLPMIDNIRLPDDRRLSVVLDSFGTDSAQITLVAFPGGYAGLIEKPYFQDLVNQLIAGQKSSGRSGTLSSEPCGPLPST